MKSRYLIYLVSYTMVCYYTRGPGEIGALHKSATGFVYEVRCDSWPSLQVLFPCNEEELIERLVDTLKERCHDLSNSVEY